MITQSMFDDFEEKAVNDALIRAVEGKDISTLMFTSLPSYTELKEFEKKLKDEDKINFQSIFHEPLGFYCIKLFLSSDYAIDKAIFVKDVETYRQMRFESARKKVARLLFQRFIAYRDVTSTIEFANDGISIFEILRKQQEDEKIREEKKDEAKRNPSIAQDTLLSTPSTRPSVGGVGSGYRQVPTHHHLPSSQQGEKPGSGSNVTKSPNDSPYEMSKSSTNTMPSKSADGEEGEGKEGGKGGLDTSQLQMGAQNNPVGVYGPTVDRIRDKIENKKDASPNLFDEAFSEVMNDLKLDIFPRFLKSEFYEKYIRTKFIETKKVKFEDFSIFRPLGRGGFGTVYAVQKKDCGIVYAMKCMNKRLLQKKDAIKNILEERQILTLFHSKFVTNLKYAFQDENHLYLVMDLMLGGDLKYHLRQAQGRFSERRARFYAAEILLGLEQLHAQKIIYRDLKFENVLLDSFGHCRLSDMGLARVTDQKIRGYAGTPGYAAPEMMHGHRYGSSVDIFSFGVLLYRMLMGSKPFDGKDLDEAVYNNKPVFPKDKLSKNAIRILEALLQKKPEHRLGCGPRGIQEIKEHVFFEKIDWGLLEAGYIDPPFIPRKSKINTETMKNLEKEKDADRKYDKIKLDEKFKDLVASFEFISQRALQEEMVKVLEKGDSRVNYEKFASSSTTTALLHHEKAPSQPGSPGAKVEEEVPPPKGCCTVS